MQAADIEVERYEPQCGTANVPAMAQAVEE